MTTSRRRWWFGEESDNRWVVPTAVALIAVQLAYRASASLGSWWESDDLTFIARDYHPGGLGLHALLGGIAGHVMPGGLLLTWVANQISPLNYLVAAWFLVVLQALASAGLLTFLLVAFGRRWSIVPPLVLYLATAFTVQATVWWATGVQALPTQIALFWALAAQVRYLQTRRTRWALAAVGCVALGLLFYEKAILVIAAEAMVALCYFAEGTLRQRTVAVWARYRAAVVAHVALGVTYLAVYAHYGLTFGPAGALRSPIGPTIDVVVLRSWGSGVVGGPLHWTHDPHQGPVSFARPSPLLTLLAWVVIVLVVRELARTRTCSMRALLLPVFFLVTNVLLLVAGRALGGANFGYEYRYIAELSGVTAVALALATSPVRGAVEQVAVTAPGRLLDRPRVVAAACAGVVLLGSVSCQGYFENWRSGQAGKDYYQTLAAGARGLPRGTAVVDTTVPGSLIWELDYPNNLVSRILAPLDSGLRFVTAATDTLLMPRTDGRFTQLVVSPVRRNVPAGHASCPNEVGSHARTIRLDGPVLYGGWWVRVGYVATASSAVTVSAGGETHRTSVTAGGHTLYFAAGDRPFRSISIGGLIGEARLCTDDVTVGRVEPAGAP